MTSCRAPCDGRVGDRGAQRRWLGAETDDADLDEPVDDIRLNPVLGDSAIEIRKRWIFE
jgi:hypothetical protein